MPSPPPGVTISKWNLVHHLNKRKLLIAVNAIASTSIFFFGYDQGMMGGVNNAKDYIDTMGFGYVATVNGVPNTPVITNSVLQGAIVAIYYIGTLIGSFLGGWFGDKYGRTRAIAFGAAWGTLGASLQCSAQNHDWMICARLINGVGTGILNTIVPVYATETAEYTSRGMFFSIEFVVNIFGVVVAYWLEYGLSFIDDGKSQIRWRFPIAFQIIPLLMLLAFVWLFPETPRWLVKVGREVDARYVLGRLRGEDGDDFSMAEAEFQDIKNTCELEKTTVYNSSYWSMITGKGSGKMHIGRRVQLAVWLQIMQEWVGIGCVTVYGPSIFAIAGFDTNKSQWLAGLNNIFYMFSTLVCVFLLDKIGRRWTLYWGAVVQGIAMFLGGGFSRLGINARAAGDVAQANKYGDVAVAMIFIYLFVFGATWLIVPWLYPAEIFPLSVRAKGNAWGVVGWSIGNFWLCFLCPVMFSTIDEKTLYLFGITNIISLPVVWAFYPETNQRTLEEMNLVFQADVPWVWTAEKDFARLKLENPELVQAAHAAEPVVDPETGLTKKLSSVVGSVKHHAHRHGDDEKVIEPETKAEEFDDSAAPTDAE